LYTSAPWYSKGLALYAGLLTRTGQAARGQALLQTLKLDSPDANTTMAAYYLLCDDYEQAAHWFERALAKRDATATIYIQLSIAKGLRASVHWPKLAQLMNLPL
jgi:TPR repeat protein